MASPVTLKCSSKRDLKVKDVFISSILRKDKESINTPNISRTLSHATAAPLFLTMTPRPSRVRTSVKFVTRKEEEDAKYAIKKKTKNFTLGF